MLLLVSDSPGVPPSATAHELFRGFSYVAPSLNTISMVSPAPTEAAVPSSLGVAKKSANGNGVSGGAGAGGGSGGGISDQDSTATVVEVNMDNTVSSRIHVVSE